MSKLAKLYHLYPNYRNVIWIFLLSIFFLNTSFYDEKEKNHNKIRTIVIDPGHGGHDPGNLGTGRYKKTEKHIALDISLKLGSYIQAAYPEINIIYTRKTNEKFLKLSERTKLANDNNADLFLSIHCDAFKDPNAYGAGVYVMGMSKLKANMEVAMFENSVIYLEDDYQENYDGFDPNSPESYIIFSLTQNTHLDQSLLIAEEVADQFLLRANRRSRGVKQAPFYVISRANMPSILIECGFLTNPAEEDYLHSNEGQDYLASAIFLAFNSYKENIEQIGGKGKQKNVLNESVRSQIKQKKEIKNRVVDIKENKNKEVLDKVIFKVQIGMYLKSMLSEKLFQEINAEEVIVNDTYKYLVGHCDNKKEIDELKNQMLKKGFKGSFVVAFYKGRKISTREALDLQKKNYNYE